MPIIITVAAIRREKEATDARLYEDALSLIETRARALLAAHPVLDEFVMGMGAWIFTKRNGHDNISTVFRDRIPAYARSFTRMMDDFDKMELKVTGEPMRFTAQGPMVSDWGVCDGLDGNGVAAKYGGTLAT